MDDLEPTVLRTPPADTSALAPEPFEAHVAPWLADEAQRHATRTLPGVGLTVGLRTGYAWRAVTPHMAIAVVIRGGCNWRAATFEARCTPGDLFVLDAGTGHRGEGEPDSAFAILWLDSGRLARLRGETGAPAPLGPAVLRDPALHRGAVELALALVDAAQANPGDVRPRPVAEQRLAQWWQAFEPQLRSLGVVPPRPRRRSRVARSLLETNLARRQPVPDVARSVGLSPEEFTRQYTADMGLSPAAWQLEQRLHRAATMLAQQVPVVQVAHACGFADASHLGRHFKRRFRVSPARWASDHSAPGPAARPQSNE